MREQRTIGHPFTASLEIYEATKGTAILKLQEEPRRVRYEVEFWEIVSGEDAAQIEAETDYSCIDEAHEYLVLHLTNGEVATFRNSHVFMFVAR